MSASRPVTLSPDGRDGGPPPLSRSIAHIHNNSLGGSSRQQPIIIDDEDDIDIVHTPRTVHSSTPTPTPTSHEPSSKAKAAARTTLAISSRSSYDASALSPVRRPLASSSSTELTFHDLLIEARGRLRPIICPWADCDALLCSFNLLKKHLIRHYAHDLTHARRKGGFPHIVCGWHGCEQDGLYSTQLLSRHVAEAHLASFADTMCPFQGCRYESKSMTSMRAHAESSHVKPWTVQRLRPSSVPATVARLPSKPLPKVCTAVELDRPVRPYMRPAAQAMRRKRSRSGSSPAPALFLNDLRHEIRPEWGDSFHPLFGDAPIFLNRDQASSNIFDGGPKAPAFVTSGRAFALVSSSGPADRVYAPLRLVARPSKPRMPILYTDAAHAPRAMPESKSKGKAVAHAHEPSDQEVDRAAKEFARKQIHTVTGFDNWRIRAEFLRCGDKPTQYPP